MFETILLVLVIGFGVALTVSLVAYKEIERRRKNLEWRIDELKKINEYLKNVNEHIKNS